MKVKCPVCHGKGFVPAFHNEFMMQLADAWLTCNACDGEGLQEVNDEAFIKHGKYYDFEKWMEIGQRASGSHGQCQCEFCRREKMKNPGLAGIDGPI